MHGVTESDMTEPRALLLLLLLLLLYCLTMSAFLIIIITGVAQLLAKIC